MRIVVHLGSIIVLAIAAATLPLGCQTTEPGVKSTGLEQYTTIEAGTAKVTDAAAAVLKDLGLHDVEASATNIDGWAKGMMADKTPVLVTLRRVDERISDISVKVGTYGDTDLGKDIIARTRRHLGLVPMSSASTTRSEATK